MATLVEAAERVWNAYLAYGPVNDGRPEGHVFELALESLMEASVEAKHDPAAAVLAAAVVAAARELVAHAEGDTEPTVDGYDLDRLRTALADLDAAKGGQ